MTYRKSKLATQIQIDLVKHFVAGTPARTAAEIVEIHRNSAQLYYHKLRILISQKLLEQSPTQGEFEVDESYFGGVRKGKRGRGAAGKIPVFGILKRGGKVYTQVIADAKSETLMPILKTKVLPDSIVYTDSFKSYNVLDISGFHHFRVNHQKMFVASQKNHINGIENFWNQAKRHLRKYNGIPRQHFYLFLKECEWRFNHGPPKQLVVTLLKWLDL